MEAASHHLRVLGLPEQYAHMAVALPAFRVVKRTRTVIVWEGILQPTPLSERYTIRLEYALPNAPKVFVVKPELTRRRPEEPIPHMYEQKTLCLFLPFGSEWTGEQSLAHLIPWASLWLAHYEAWHATGEWLGGGVHPPRSTGRKKP